MSGLRVKPSESLATLSSALTTPGSQDGERDGGDTAKKIL